MRATYKQHVKITRGFYRGRTGTVLKEDLWGLRFLVDLDPNNIDERVVWCWRWELNAC